MLAVRRSLLALVIFCAVAAAQTYSAPAGIRPPLRRPAASILPGGRIVVPLGLQRPTGAGPFALAISSSGRTVVTSNLGPGPVSLTVLEKDRNGGWGQHQVMAAEPGKNDPDAWTSLSMGLALSGDHEAFVSEGNSGRVSLLDLTGGSRRRVIDLNQGGFSDSFTGALALDEPRDLLYVVDEANFRVAVWNAKSRQMVASIHTGYLPFALALSADRRKLYVTNVGMFRYQPVPGSDPAQARATGLSFPAFGFPSAEASRGVERMTARGPVQVPGLGDPHARESNSVCVINVADPAEPKVEAFVRTGEQTGTGSIGGSSPSGILATAGRVFVSNAGSDSITVLNAANNQVEAEIPIRIPGLESLRGVLPVGMAYDEASEWLLVAEAGINAVGVVDTRTNRVIGHLPVAWFPTQVAIDHGNVYVTSARGMGAGPNFMSRRYLLRGAGLGEAVGRGALSIFKLPAASDLAKHTNLVMEADGFQARDSSPAPLPSGVRYVVLIVKEGRTFDDVLGDVDSAGNGPVMNAPSLAHFGSEGYADGHRQRLSLHHVDLTPNQHAIAAGWAFSDNFYADSSDSIGGHHWLAGSYPNAWSEVSALAASAGEKDFRPQSKAPGRLSFSGPATSPLPEDLGESGTLWQHLARHGVSFYSFGEGLDLAGSEGGEELGPTGVRFFTNAPMPEDLYQNTSHQYPGLDLGIPDQYRASQFIQEITDKFVKAGRDLPRFVYLCLPNDYTSTPRPERGYPYEESYVVDNDYALGRILQFLSMTKWWKQMAVFVTEASAADGFDHVDAHRTLLLAAGPWCKKNYVSHVNTSFPGLLKTIFRLLSVPSMTLFDAAATDLSDCFRTKPDYATYEAVPIDRRVFDLEAAQKNGL
ncbi:MAG TPA: hypothetical protein VG675_11720 [Bryobacteraceae bacterium]|nr:hypothetical protein [Bryobacteraceae bacterium]